MLIAEHINVTNPALNNVTKEASPGDLRSETFETDHPSFLPLCVKTKTHPIREYIHSPAR